MVKKSTRVLSFILSALLLVSMLPVVSLAEEAKYYTYDEAATTKNYYDKLDFTALVGPANEDDTPHVFIIDADWNYKAGAEPKSVSFTFRGEKITETYKKNRHVANFTVAIKYVTDNAIKNPVFILTEGVYSDSLTLVNGFTVLGPKAGINPNVPDADPTKEWALSGDRKLPTQTKTNGEAVFRVENAGENGTHNINGGNNSVGTQNYIIDGVVFQGNGTGVADEASAGSGTRNWYIQNCIFDDCHSLGGRGGAVGIGFDRRSGQTYTKNLYVSNTYVVNQNTKQLYSGHATSVHFNGVSVQNCIYSLCAKIQCLQWQGQTTEVTNCHFWNPKGSERDGTYFPVTWDNYCNSGVGTDGALFSAIFRNNSFYHVNRGDAPIIQFGVAGNTNVVIEENIFISEENGKARAPINVKYITVNGEVTHNGIGQTIDDVRTVAVVSNAGDYKLTNEQFMVRNNTFIGSEFMTLPNIGTNLNNETAVELLGNLYLEKLGDKNGQMIDPYVEDAKIYNKWVWLDADRTVASSEIVEEDISITSGGQPTEKEGYDLSLTVDPKEYTKQINVTCNAENHIRVYESDASWTKGAQVEGDNGAYTLNTEWRSNYYIVTITSTDQRTELNYKLTIERGTNPDAQLNAVLPETDVLSSSNDKTTYNYTIDYANKNFAFKLDTSANADVSVWNMSGIIYPDANGVYTTHDLKEDIETVYEIWVLDQQKNKEVYYLNIFRTANDETELLNVTAPEASSVTADGTTFTVKVPSNTTALNLSAVVSDGAVAEMIDPIYQMPVYGKNGVFTIDPVLGGKNTYTVTVHSQDGEHSQDWLIVVEREAKTGCELLGIAGTEKVGNMYVGYTANKEFLISATVSEGATYKIYTDAACTQATYSPRVQLTQTTNDFWIKVFAEDTAYVSEPIKILINTFADTTEPDDTPVKLPMNDDGILGVTGGEFAGNVVVIPLAPETEKYTFRVQGFDEYVARVYSDKTETPMRPANAIDITLDSGRTTLYVTATKGTGANKIVKEYTVHIVAPRVYTYTDKQVDWAADYIAEVGANGWGLMKGYPDGSFGGDKQMTRYEMAALMVRVSGANVHLYTAARNPFSDAIADWALNYVKAASRMGMINGYEVINDEGVTVFEYQGDKNSTRSEFFRVFANAVLGKDVDEYYKAYKKTIDAAVEKLGLADLDAVADWARPAIYTAIYLKLVVGDQNKKINPENNITRNEVAVVLGRFYNTL
ncbi:MAG: S-layer homology domain-containing protein [Clostridia bacterium]|nr:S-layer homology domain-containing protein [Clostridia bacterium]